MGTGGQIIDGVLHCDCNPPLLPKQLKVRKEGYNKGKDFWKCPLYQDDKARCDLFVWDKDKVEREKAARKSDPPRSQRVASPTPPHTPETGVSQPNRKRSRDEEDFGFEHGNVAIKQELDQVTPSKRPRIDTFAPELSWQAEGSSQMNALRTPQTEQRPSHDTFAACFSAPGGSLPTGSHYWQVDDSHIMTPASSQNTVNITPTPNRCRDVGPASGSHGLTRDVFGVLNEANVQLNDQTRRKLAAVLLKHATAAEGARKARDVAMAEIKDLSSQVTDKKYHITELESQLHAQLEAGIPENEQY